MTYLRLLEDLLEFVKKSQVGQGPISPRLKDTIVFRRNVFENYLLNFICSLFRTYQEMCRDQKEDENNNGREGLHLQLLQVGGRLGIGLKLNIINK